MSEPDHARTGARRLRAERGGIVTGWIFKIAVMLAVLGVSVFEAGSIIVAKLSVDRIAIEASQEAGLEYGRTRKTSEAEAVASQVAERQDAELVGHIEVSREYSLVTVTVRKEANTLIIGRIGFLKKYTVQTASHSGRIR